MSLKIFYINRKASQLEEEQIAGEGAIRWLYDTKWGYAAERGILSHKPLSALFGFYNDSKWSAKRIPQFVKDFKIPLEDFEVPAQGFQSFNDFFYRRYKKEKRSFPRELGIWGAPAEGRVFVFDGIDETRFFPIKGQGLQLETLLGSAVLAKTFQGGVGLVIRLCPTDYHRFHFPDDGVVREQRTIAGALHSVNPMALRKRPQIFQENERVLTLFESKHFGLMATLEIGAMCVGRIVQTVPVGSAVVRGDEKGYFCFGGSSIVWFAQKGVLTPARDLIENTQRGYETLVQLGEPLGVKTQIP